MLFTNSTRVKIDLFVRGDDGQPARAVVSEGGAPTSLGPGRTLEIPEEIQHLSFDVQEHGIPSLTLGSSADVELVATPLGDPTLTDPDISLGLGQGRADALGDPTLTDPDSKKDR